MCVSCLFVDLRIANGANGLVKEGQTVFEVTCKHEVQRAQTISYEGLRLVYDTGDFVRPQRTARAPIHRVRRGPLRAMTEGELARSVIESVSKQRADLMVSKVVFRKLNFRNISLFELEATSVDESFEAITVEVEQVVVRQRKQQPGGLRDLSAIFDRPRVGSVSTATSSGVSRPATNGCVAQDTEPGEHQERDDGSIAGVLDDLGLSGTVLEDSGILAEYRSILGDDLAKDLEAVLNDMVGVEQAEAAAAEAAAQAAAEAEARAELATHAIGNGVSSSGGEQHGQEAASPSLPPPPPPPPSPELGQVDRWSDLPLREVSRWRFALRESGQDIGVLHQLGLNQLKATCKRKSHKGRRPCVCWLSNVTDLQKAERDLVRWLAAGEGSADDHADIARDLKLTYGMRVRGPSRAASAVAYLAFPEV